MVKSEETTTEKVVENNVEATVVEQNVEPTRERRQFNDKEKNNSEFKEELLSIDRVTRVTAGWRQLRFRAVMLVWNWKWKVWLWTWKSWEVVDAIAKAINDAKKNMQEVTIENWSVPYDIKVKFKSAIVRVHPASKWTWLIAWGAVRKVLSVAGYSDVIAKRFWSTNLLNNAKAALSALSSFKK